MTAVGRSRWMTLLLYGSLTVLAVVWLVPTLSSLAIATLPLSQTRAGWWNLSPADLTFGNFARAWDQGLSRYAVNSFIITGLAVVLTVSAGSLAAYAYARMAFRFKAMTYFLLITTMIVPVQIILIPMLPWFRTLGLNAGPQEYLGIALVHTAFGAGWAIFMLGAFFAQIPEDLLEAARIDGAGWFDVFRRIALPLAVPGIVSFAIIDFVFVWNDLLLALTLLDRAHQPLTVGLANLQTPHLAQEDLVSAGTIMAILPPLVLFAALNRFYVRGLFAGATKGSAIEVVVLQMAARPGELAANVDRLAELVGKHADGAELVVAPELVTSGYDLEVLARRGQELAEPLDGPTAARVSELATEVGATLVFGMLERDGDALYDTAVVAAPDGQLVPYRKSHLYPTESELFAAGTELVVAPTPAGRLGMMICFEHAFPDVATTLALRGAQILVIPSAVPFGYEHLLTLRTRARAQDNQVFAVGCNLTGNGFCGGSLVADPRGEVLAEAGTEETVVRATLDLAAIEREREREPALRLRQPDLYRHGRL
jgi:ABC-type glycerol-3-phosphate transport system permease component/predicted amidohydrolase